MNRFPSLNIHCLAKKKKILLKCTLKDVLGCHLRKSPACRDEVQCLISDETPDMSDAQRCQCPSLTALHSNFLSSQIYFVLHVKSKLLGCNSLPSMLSKIVSIITVGPSIAKQGPLVSRKVEQKCQTYSENSRIFPHMIGSRFWHFYPFP